MSCYEWERGTITIPSKKFSAFRKQIISDWNNYRLQLFEAAKLALPKIRAACKSKENWTATDTAVRIAAEFTKEPEALVALISSNEGGKIKFASPKKKDLGLLPISKIGQALHFEDASIVFSSSANTVIWDVGENNHAREYARDHPMGRAFFRALHAMEWVRGTGGTIIGNDEYNRDADYEGGGGNYITASFGPASKLNNKALRRQNDKFRF